MDENDEYLDPLLKERELIERVMVEITTFGVPPGVNRKKNAKDSIEYRQKGNELFRSQSHNWKKHEQVLDYYSKSIALAPNNSEELAFAYGNRSALLLHLEKYKECIEDCNLALNITICDNLEAKLLCRKAECLAALKDPSTKHVCEDALEVLQQLTTVDDRIKSQLIDKLNNILHNLSILNDEVEKQESENEIQNCDEELSQFIEDLAVIKDPEVPEDLMQGRKMLLEQSSEFMEKVKAFAENTLRKKKAEIEPSSETLNLKLPTFKRQKEAPCASDAVTITYNKEWGRHLAATRDIDPGEIIAIEESCFQFIFPNGMYLLCSHCAKYAWTSIPCKYCIYGVYCSKNCRAEAWNKYHKFECEVFGDVWDIGEDLKSNPASIRFLLMAVYEAGGISEIREYLTKLVKNKDLRTRGFSAEGTFPDKKCISLLTTNFDVDEYDDDMKYNYAMTAASALCLIAKKTQFFGKRVDIKNMDLLTWDDFLFMGALLMRCFMLIPRVCFPLKEYHFEYLESIDYGFIAHPFCNLMNHSCDPNVLRIKTYDNEAIVYAKYPIKKGEQLFVCYTQTFLEAPRYFRQGQLKEVHKFTCNCLPCKKKWNYEDKALPLSTSITNKNPKIREELSKEVNQKDVVKVVQNMISENYKFDPEIIETLIKLQKCYAEKITVHCDDFQGFTTFLFNIYQKAFGSLNNMPDKCTRHSN